jgi:dye decolorizing peroxidase
VFSDDAVPLSYAVRRLVPRRPRAGDGAMHGMDDLAAAVADFGPAAHRRTQRGFNPARGSEPAGTTPRNLFGQRDGPDWFVGGTVLVLRRIRMDLDIWDDFGRAGKEMATARRLDDGAPLTGGGEFDDVGPRTVDGQGFPIAVGTGHVVRAIARTPAEVMLRRGFSFDDGPTRDDLPDAGLLFAAFQADAATAFVPVQARLAESDVMNLWITHIGSAAFAIPPGCAPGEFVGQRLLAQA